MLLLASLVTLPIRGRRVGRGMLVLVALATAASLLPSTPAFRLQAGDEIRVDKHTPYHHITVVDNPAHGTRQLRFDKFTESAIRLEEPYASLLRYTNYFQLAFLARPKMDRVLFIGAGGGVGPRAFFAHDPNLKIEVVDIDAQVLDIARDYFFMPDSAAVTSVAEDGRMFLRHSAAKYDCIVLDAFTIGGRIPFHLVTQEFFDLCRQRLTDDGVFVMNFGSALEGPRSQIFRSMYRTAHAVFPNVYVFAHDIRDLGPTRTTNIILLGSNVADRIPDGEWLVRAQQYRSASYVQAPEMSKMAQDLIGVQAPDTQAPIFTDDYAPIETTAF